MARGWGIGGREDGVVVVSIWSFLTCPASPPGRAVPSPHFLRALETPLHHAAHLSGFSLYSSLLGRGKDPLAGQQGVWITSPRTNFLGPRTQSCEHFLERPGEGAGEGAGLGPHWKPDSARAGLNLLCKETAIQPEWTGPVFQPPFSCPFINSTNGGSAMYLPLC